MTFKEVCKALAAPPKMLETLKAVYDAGVRAGQEQVLAIFEEEAAKETVVNDN